MERRIFIIAEAGINHNGSLEIAKELIDAAADAGCDAIKFQKRSIEIVYTKEFLDSNRDSPWGTTQRHQKEALEFSHSDYEQIDAYCKSKSIEWFASAWDKNSIEFLTSFDLKHNKVASAMLPDLSFLRVVARQRKHTFISTGMSDIKMIDAAVSIFREENCPFELMHAVSTYPMKDEDANLLCIPALRERYGCNVGYSGHEVGLVVSYAAAALGITSLERHITLDRAMYGSDQAASIEPAGLRSLVSGVRKIANSMGNGEKKIQPEEIPIAQKLRQHLDLASNH